MHFLDSQVLSRFTANESSRDIHVTTLTEKALRSSGRFGIQKLAVEKEFTFTCPQSGSEPSQRWHYLRVYPTNLTTDSKDVIRLQFLSMLLFRGQSSPFYKSLIESQKARLFNPLQG